MNTRTKHSIFESPSQLTNHKPEDVRPILDRLLIRDLGDPEKEGLIFLPHKADEDRPLLRQGMVVAVGLGDKWVEKGLDGHGVPIRKMLQQRAPTLCKVGDRVLYDRRRECEVFLAGVVHSLVHEEQSVLAVLES